MTPSQDDDMPPHRYHHGDTVRITRGVYVVFGTAQFQSYSGTKMAQVSVRGVTRRLKLTSIEPVDDRPMGEADGTTDTVTIPHQRSNVLRPGGG